MVVQAEMIVAHVERTLSFVAVIFVSEACRRIKLEGDISIKLTN